MAAEEYLLNIVTRFDDQGINAFVADVKRALGEIEAAAQQAARTGTSLAGSSQAYQQVEAEAYGTVARAQNVGAIGVGFANELTKVLQQSFAPVAASLAAINRNFQPLAGNRLLEAASGYARETATAPVYARAGRGARQRLVNEHVDARDASGEEEEPEYIRRRRYLQASRGIDPSAMAAEEVAAMRQAIKTTAEEAQVNRAYGIEQQLATARRMAQNQYGEAQQAARAAAFGNVVQGQEAGARAQDPFYNRSVAYLAAANNRAAAAEDEARAGSSAYLRSTERLATSRAELAAAEAQTLADSSRYNQATARAAIARDNQRAAEARAQTTAPAAQAAARAQLAEERRARAAESAFLGQRTEGDIRDTASIQLERERQRVATALEVERQRTTEDTTAAAELALARRRAATEQQRAQLGYGPAATPELRYQAAQNIDEQGAARAEQAFANAQQKLAEVARSSELVSAEGLSYAEVLGQARAAQQGQTAAIRAAQFRAQANDPTFISSTAEANQYQSLMRDRVRMAELGVTVADEENVAQRQAAIAVAQRAQADRQRLAEIEMMQGEESGEAALIVQRKMAEREYNRVLNARIQQEIEARAEAGDPAFQGTGYQRLMQRISVRQGGTPRLYSEFPTGPQAIGQRLATTVGFAASGIALFGAMRSVRELTQEADKLDHVMSQVRAEFEALGQGSEVSTFRSGILSIARDTGLAADQVAQIGIQMKGAFGDTPTALEATRQTAEAMKVTGLEGADAINTFVALAKTFGVSVQDVSDKALGLQDRFGVMAKEIIQGASSIAPVARQVGLGINDLMAIVASAAQVTGRPAQSVAEGLGRILPQLQKQAAPLIELYRSVPALTPHLGEVQQAFASGNEGEVLTRLIRDWHSLTQAQQDNALALLGGRREAQVLADALQDPDRLVQELDGHMNDAGRTTRAYSELQTTLTQTLARVREEFRQVGDSLARSGALDAVKALAGGTELLVGTLGFLVRIFADVNQFLHGFPGQIAAVTFGFIALQKAIEAIEAMRGVKAALPAVLARVAGPIGGEAAAAEGAVAGGLTPEAMAVLAGAQTSTGVITDEERARLIGRTRVIPGIAPGGRLLSRIGTIGQMNVPGLGRFPGLPGFGGEAGIGSAAGITEGGLFAAGSASLGGLTLGLGVADMLAIRQAQTEYNRLRSSERAAGQINERQFRGETLQQLLANRDIYNAPGRGQGYNALQALALGPIAPVAPSREAMGDLLGGRIGIGDFLRNRTQAAKQQQQAIQRETVSEFDVLAAAGALSGTGMSQAEIDELKKRVDASEGKGGAGKDARRAIAEATRNNGKQVRELVSKGKQAQNIRDQAAAGQTTAQIQTIQDVQEALAAGQLNYPEAIRQIEAQLADLRGADQGTSTPELHKQVLAGVKALQQVETQRLQQEAQFAQSLGQALGTNPITAMMPALEAQLGILGASPNTDQQSIINTLRRHGEQVPQNQTLSDLLSGNITPETAEQIGGQALAAQHQALLDAMQHASSQAEALRIGQAGAQVNPQIRTVLIEAARRIGGDNAANEMQRILDSQVHLSDAELDQAQQQALQEAISAIQASVAGARDPAVQTDAARRVAQAQLEAANARRADDPNKQQAIDAANIAAAQANNQAEDNATAARNAAHGAYQASLNRDPLAIARDRRTQAQQNLDEAKRQNRGAAAISDAQRQLDEANQAVDDASVSIANARLELLKAQYADDPIKQAQLDQQIADEAARNAHGTAEKLKAQAQRVAADRALDIAMNELSTSKMDLIKAQLSFHGDSAGAAAEQVEIDKKNIADLLGRLRAQKIDPNQNKEYQDLQTQLVNDQASSRQALISQNEREIDNDLTLKRISIGEAVARLRQQENLARSLGAGKDELDAIEIKIQQLLQTQDLQFNIPSELKLPTMYEVRRYGQSQRMGMGYNDNRQIVVNMNITNGMDQAAASRFLSDAIGRSNQVVVTAGTRRV